jgi:digeranylgeranylglycerophospholipid reductase
MKEDFDIVVVGAGPCGSFSALEAAKQGAKVAVIEEHQTIGKRTHCAGHISIRGLRTLGVEPPSRMIENRIRMAKFYAPSGKTICIDCRHSVTYVVNRALFDQHLAGLAEQAGVSYLNQVHADSLLIDSNHVQGVLVKGRERARLGARIVIDAEGAGAGLLRKNPSLIPSSATYVTGAQGYSAKVRDLDDESVEIYLGRGYAPGFFAWIIPRHDGTAKIGLATNKGNPRVLLDNFAEKHPIASKKIAGPLSDTSFHPIPLSGPSSTTYGNGLLVVGDAASQVKPITGGGVVFGLTCSNIAGNVAAEAVRAGDCSSRFLSMYQRLWREELGREFWVGRRARWIMNRLSDRAIDRVFSIGKAFDVGDSLGQIGEVDFAGRVLGSSLRKPNVAFAFLCSLFSCLLP